MLLVSRRARIVAIRVSVADAPVETVDHDIGLLVFRDRNGCFDGLSLRGLDDGRFLVAGANDGPAVVMLRDVLVFSHKSALVRLDREVCNKNVSGARVSNSDSFRH